MKKRLFSLVLALVLCLGLCPAVLAYGDMTYDKDTLITAFGADYDNVVVKAGVTVTFKERKPDPNALFIHKSLTVEEGGRITGPGTIGLFQGCTYSGIDLYYRVRGEEALLDQEKLDWLIADDPEHRLIFWWNAETGHFATLGYGFEFDPFFDGSAVKDVEYPESADLRTVQSYQWNNCVIRSGATVTLSEGGKELHGALTLEEGGRLIGGHLDFFRGASVTGLTLWYRVQGETLPVPGNDPSSLLPEDEPDRRLNFMYEEAGDRYVLSGEFGQDPFQSEPTAEDSAALRLQALGLFIGTGTDFELHRPAKRTEAVVMLIRLLGQEAKALEQTADYPYDDVPAWANRYVAYAFATGLTNGVGDGVFGEGEATARQFLTFVLRSLGYRDESTGGEDFSWRSPENLALELGLIRGLADLEGYNRGNCVFAMEKALTCPNPYKRPLWELLAEQGAFTREDYLRVYGNG